MLPSLIAPALTNRGFTGHEHIDEIGLKTKHYPLLVLIAMSKNNYSTRQIMQLMQIALTNNLTQVRMILAIGMPDTRGNAWLDMNGRVYDPSIGRILISRPTYSSPL